MSDSMNMKEEEKPSVKILVFLYNRDILLHEP